MQFFLTFSSCFLITDMKLRCWNTFFTANLGSHSALINWSKLNYRIFCGNPAEVCEKNCKQNILSANLKRVKLVKLNNVRMQYFFKQFKDTYIYTYNIFNFYFYLLIDIVLLCTVVILIHLLFLHHSIIYHN